MIVKASHAIGASSSFNLKVHQRVYSAGCPRLALTHLSSEHRHFPPNKLSFPHLKSLSCRLAVGSTSRSSSPNTPASLLRWLSPIGLNPSLERTLILPSHQALSASIQIPLISFSCLAVGSTSRSSSPNTPASLLRWLSPIGRNPSLERTPKVPSFEAVSPSIQLPRLSISPASPWRSPHGRVRLTRQRVHPTGRPPLVKTIPPTNADST